MKKYLLVSTLLAMVSTGYANYDQSDCFQCGSFEVGADWLYWKTYQDNMEFAAHVALVGTDIHSEIIPPEFNYNSGFRVYAWYTANDCCPWQIGGIFSRITSQGTRTDIAEPFGANTNFITLNSINFPIFTALTSNNAILSLFSSDWESKLNYFDLDVCRFNGSFLGLEISPHMGLRGLWIRETITINGSAPGLGSMFTSLNQKYDGYGLEGGLYADLPLCFGLSLTGHLGGSLLYAKIDVDERLEVSAGGLPVINLNYTIYHLSPTIDGFIGLAYNNTCFCHHINLHVGWEQHIIMNSNHLSTFNYSDLTLQGLTLGGSISF